jgi:hypothetical protein
MADISSVQELQNGRLFKSFIGFINDSALYSRTDMTIHINHMKKLLEQLLKRAGKNALELFTTPSVYVPICKFSHYHSKNSTCRSLGMGIVHILTYDGKFPEIIHDIIIGLHAIDPLYSKLVLEIEDESMNSMLDYMKRYHKVLYVDTLFDSLNYEFGELSSMLEAKTTGGLTILHLVNNMTQLMRLKPTFDMMSISKVLDQISVEFQKQSILHSVYPTAISQSKQFIEFLEYLHLRCSDPDLQKFQKLLLTQNGNGKSMFHLAIIYGNSEVIRTLIAVSPSGGSMEIKLPDTGKKEMPLDMLKRRIRYRNGNIEANQTMLGLLESIEPYLLTKGAK